MIDGLYRVLARPALFRLDAERAHTLSIAALKAGIASRPVARPDPSLACQVAGLQFPNPVGLAPGYDKNGEVPDAALRLGFGFVEVGTVTPKAQPGNPRPRIFRLVEDEGVINRLGFNNAGHAACLARLQARGSKSGILGVNIGANKDSTDRIADYVEGVRTFASLASYLTVNISSPNTPGLRDMQARAVLDELLGRVLAQRDALGRTPVFLKIAPDLVDAELEEIADTASARGIDGVIVSNTTLSREGLTSRLASETGGVSGRPLFERSTIMLARMRRLVGPSMPLIGVGGVDSAAAAVEKIAAGADLVQLYSGLVYQGPGLPARIVRDLSRYVRRECVSSLRELRDSRTDLWAGRRLV